MKGHLESPHLDLRKCLKRAFLLLLLIFFLILNFYHDYTRLLKLYIDNKNDILVKEFDLSFSQQ